jgi:hypothetical protein
MKRPFAKRRRLIIQLAALVDLLFVVMFLQYTEQTRTAAEEASRLNAAAARAQEVKSVVLADQENLRKQRDELQGEVDLLRKRLLKETAKNVDIEKQLRQLGEVARETLAGVDPKAVTAALSGAPAEDVTAILGALEEAKGKNAAQVIQMLRKSSELKNWCDVWEVHLFPDGRVRVRGPNTRDREFLPSDENDLALQFMQVVKQAGEPKSLVLIMFTHGNAELKALDIVMRGLEQVRTIWSAQAAGKKIQVTAPKYSAEAP